MGLLNRKKRQKKGKGNVEQPSSSSVASIEETLDQVLGPEEKPKKKKVDWINVIVILIMIVGACVIAYPTFSDWWNSYHQTRAIANYVTAVEETDPELIEQMLDEAHAYNERLLLKSNRYIMSDAEKAEYESILDLTGSGVIGYIQINSIGVNLPIYHGISESVLQIAIGHLEGTSLPVGGATTHAAVSGHRGLPSARLFTDLDKLVEGDTFTITVLNQTITYEVDQIRIVEPSDISDLNLVQDADLVTLITCTPYGINTHRLLVRGHRIANIDGTAVIPPEAVQIPNYVAVPAVALPMLFVYLVGALIYYRRRGRRYNRAKVLKELEEMAGIEGAEAGETEAAAEGTESVEAAEGAEAAAEVAETTEVATEAAESVEAAETAAEVAEAAEVAAQETEAEAEPEDEAAEAEEPQESKLDESPEAEQELAQETEAESEAEEAMVPNEEEAPVPEPEQEDDSAAEPDTASEEESNDR